MYWMLMPLRRYAEFSGRSRRKEYWMYTLGVIILYVLFGGAAGFWAVTTFANGGEPDFSDMGSIGGIFIFIGVFLLIVFALFIPSLAVGARRLHDINLSGHWQWIAWGPNLLSSPVGIGSPTLSNILAVVSLLGFIALWIMAMLDGTPGPNRFGDDPKGEGSAEVFA